MSKTENRSHWKPDADSSGCDRCGVPFTFFRRRHHCRACGGIFCDAHSKARTTVPYRGIQQKVRVCVSCFPLSSSSDGQSSSSSSPFRHGSTPATEGNDNNANGDGNGTLTLGAIMEVILRLGPTSPESERILAILPEHVRSFVLLLILQGLLEASAGAEPVGADSKTIEECVEIGWTEGAVGQTCVICQMQLAPDQKASFYRSVSQEELCSNQEVASLSICGHVFHQPCIEEWLKINKTCPICRRDIQEKNKNSKDRTREDVDYGEGGRQKEEKQE